MSNDPNRPTPNAELMLSFFLKDPRRYLHIIVENEKYTALKRGVTPLVVVYSLSLEPGLTLRNDNKSDLLAFASSAESRINEVHALGKPLTITFDDEPYARIVPVDIATYQMSDNDSGSPTTQNLSWPELLWHILIYGFDRIRRLF